jgi:glutamyl endopeptidase
MVGLKKVSETRVLPYQRICQLTLKNAGATEVATGWFFGDNLVITAAHVFDRFGFGTDVTVEICPGQSAQHPIPFGAFPAQASWPSQNAGSDYAGVWLTQPIGASLGTFGIASPDIDLVTQTVDVTGYPLQDGVPDLWTVSGLVVNAEAKGLRYNLETRPGQSGSPVWLDGYSDLVVGLHSQDGFAVRFDENAVTELLAWRQGPP